MTDSGPTPGINISRYSDASEILTSKLFAPHHPEWHEMLGGCLLLLDGEEHFKRRRLETPLFTTSAMRYYESKALVPVIQRAIRRCLGDAAPGTAVRVDLVPVVLDMLYALGAAVVGIDGVDTPERAKEFAKLFITMSDGATPSHSARDQAELLQEAVIARTQFIATFYSQSFARRDGLVEQYRAGSIDEGALPRDLITSLILDSGFHEDPKGYLREIVLYMIASIRTTLHAVPHVVRHLADWTQSHSKDAQRLTDADFLRQSIIEAIRLHPALPSIVRRAKESTTLKSGLDIKRDQLVSILLDHINVDAAFFGADAATFQPDRVIDSIGPTGRGRVPGWGLAFGSGPHVCIGRRLVVGDEQDRRDEDTKVHGTAIGILRGLYAHDMTMDPDHPAKLDARTFYDAYETFPVLLTHPGRNGAEVRS